MGRRSRPRRSQRRDAGAEALARRTAAAGRWSRAALVGSAIAWGVGVLTSALAVAASAENTLVWSVGWAGRTSQYSAVAVDVEREDAVAVAAALLAVPVLLAAVGLARTRVRVRHAEQHAGRLLSSWSPAAAVVAVALLPNVVGCLWVSGTRPGSDMLLVPQAWPLFAVVLGPMVWALLVGFVPGYRGGPEGDVLRSS